MSRQLKLRAYNTSRFAELCDIIPASEYKPDWWKRQKSFVKQDDEFEKKYHHIENSVRETPIPTVKVCPAVHTQFQAGYIITAPFDMEIVADNEAWGLNLNPSVQDSIGEHELSKTFTSHPEKQFSSLFDGVESPYIGNTLKIDTGFQLVSGKPVNVMVVPPYWSHVSSFNNIVCLPATLQLSSDIYPADVGHGLIPNFLVKKNSRSIIMAGDPLLQIIPFPQQSVDLQEACLHNEDMNSMQVGISQTYYVTQKYVNKKRNFLSRYMFQNKYTKSTIDSKPWIKKFKKLFPHIKSHKSRTVDTSKFTK